MWPCEWRNSSCIHTQFELSSSRLRKSPCHFSHFESLDGWNLFKEHWVGSARLFKAKVNILSIEKLDAGTHLDPWSLILYKCRYREGVIFTTWQPTWKHSTIWGYSELKTTTRANRSREDWTLQSPTIWINKSKRWMPDHVGFADEMKTNCLRLYWTYAVRTTPTLTTWGVPYQDKYVAPIYGDQHACRFQAVYQETISSQTFVKLHSNQKPPNAFWILDHYGVRGWGGFAISLRELSVPLKTTFDIGETGDWLRAADPTFLILRCTIRDSICNILEHLMIGSWYKGSLAGFL